MDFDLRQALTEVSAQRREQALRYRHERDQRLSVAAYRLLQHALQTEYGIQQPPVLAYGTNGKPMLAEWPYIHFSLSHCREAAACVVSDNPVGIDIESIDHYDEAVAAQERASTNSLAATLERTSSSCWPRVNNTTSIPFCCPIVCARCAGRRISTTPINMTEDRKLPHPLVSLIPVAILIGLLAVVIALFGSDALSGGSQIALLFGLAVCVLISMTCYHTPWKAFERQMTKTLGDVSVTLLILLTVGMLSGSWMVSGVVPTLIYYGVQILSPKLFLVSACIICSLVSLLSGSSWTTIATIGVALLGIGQALGVSEAWTAGAIISGAYFGDKMSPLSDTTILASSSVRVDIFDHIRYMVLTTAPSILITLVIFLVTGLVMNSEGALHIEQYTDGLAGTYNISLWTLLVPLVTGILIARRVPSLMVLFISSILAGVTAVIFQPHILSQIADDASLGNVAAIVKGLAITFYGSTSVQTGYDALNDLVSTGGMAGMLNTIWLIICAMCYGSAMVASGMIESITGVIVRWVRSRVALVSSTVGTGLFLNLTTGDQFISIVLTADMFRNVYDREGYEGRLLSRTTEDAATVTSVLVPWNTCGMTQATVLGVPTLTYLPYCFVNIISPLMTILVAAIGWKIPRRKPAEEELTVKS